MTARSFLAYMRRESRGARARFLFFVACLAVGVAAIVAVGGLASGLDSGIRSEARELLAADVAISGRRALPTEVEAVLARQPEVERVEIKEMVTVVAAHGSDGVPGRSQLVELKVVAPGYPFYGAMDLEPARPLEGLLGGEEAVAAPDLLSRLGIAPGDELLVGGESFRISAVVRAEPDRVGGAFSLGPRLFLSPAGLERAGLEQYGSRIIRRTLLKLPPDGDRAAADRLAEALREALPPGRGFRVETWAEAQPVLRQGIRRAERFLGLAALLSLLIGGVGVSQTVRSWLAGRMDAIAVLRCLGCRPREVVALYLAQSAVLGLAGSLLGAALGTLVVALTPRLLADVLPGVELELLQPMALARGVGLGLGVALLFAVDPLLSAGRIPPLRVLRQDVEPPPVSRWRRAVMTGVVVGGVCAVAAVQGGTLERGLQFTLGTGVAALLLALTAWGGTRLLGRFPMRNAEPWLKNGLRALARPGAATISAVTALGLGVIFVVGMGLVERALSGELATRIPPDSPTAFLIDIQPDQWEGVRGILEDQGSTAIDSVPVVTARLTEIDGRAASELAADPERRGDRWALTREQRFTYARELRADNQIVEGELWSVDGVDEVSVEREFAEELGVGLGSVLGFDIQGTGLDLTVTSLRSVDWQTFGINFFLVVEPGVLEAAPQVRLAAARLPHGREQQVQDALAAAFPNVTLIRTREVLEKVGRVLGRLAEGVRLLGGFTVLAGIVILAGAVSAASVRRGREIALLKTLGSTRGEVVKQFLVENSLLGLVAGAVGAAGGALLARAVVTRGFELAYHSRPGFLLMAVLGTAVLTAATGVAAGWSALQRRPMDVLRGE